MDGASRRADERPLQARPRPDDDHAVRAVAAKDEPRRAAAARSTSFAATCRSSARGRASRTRWSTSSRTTSSASSCRPGITGLWQVTARARSTFVEALEMDVAYARGWSLGLDLWLLLRTPVQRPATKRRDDVSDREPVSVAVVGLGYWGPNLVRNLARARRTPRSRCVCDARRSGARHGRQRAIRRVRRRRLRRTCSPTDDVEAVADRDAGRDALRARRAPRSRPASTSSWRSRSPPRRARPRS